ncbi:MAG: hypothetical protein OXB96_01155 [Candidatus Kaiserbacteria bacterium]|nr:hypothetical protein [Candidatus Kaiserbacteria bacterium]
MKCTSLFWGGVFFPVLAVPFFVFAEGSVPVQDVSQGYSIVDAVVVFFKTFGVGFGGAFGVMWLIVRMVKGDLKDCMEKMEKTLKESIDDLKKRFERIENCIIKVSDSPIKLTEVGQKVLRESGGLDYLASNKDSLLQEFFDTDDPFVIQERAVKIIREKMEVGEFVANTEWLYKNGSTTDQVVDAVGTELRDMVFRVKGIDVDTG